MAKNALLLTSLCLAACGGANWTPVDLAKLPKDLNDGDARGVVLLDELAIDYRVGDDGKPVIDLTRHRKVKVLHEEGQARYGTVRAQYDRAFSRVLRMQVRVIRPGGKAEERTLGDAADLMASDGMSLYQSTRARLVKFQHIPVGSYVESIVSTRETRPRLWSHGLHFGGRDPIKLARLTVSAPTGWQIEHLTRLFADKLNWQPTIAKRDNLTTWTWERKELPAIKPEKWTPDALSAAPTVSVRLLSWQEDGRDVVACRTPKEVSAWLYELTAKLQVPGTAERQLADKILTGAPKDPVARVRRLHAWVRDNIDYCSIQIGWGGWRPFPSSEVLAVRYGDCKAKANLLLNLLAADGIRSTLTAVHSNGGVPAPYGLPVAFGNFNHMILKVHLPQGDVLVDPTSDVTVFGELPASDQGAVVLPISATGSDLERAPVEPAERNTEDGVFEVQLATDATATGTLRFQWTGYLAQKLRSTLLGTPTGKRDEVAGRWVELRNAKVFEAKVDSLPPGEQAKPLVLTGKFRREALLQGDAAIKLLRLNALMRPWAPRLPHSDRARHAPIELGMRRKITVRHVFEAPTGWQFSSVPKAVQVNSSAGSFSLRWQNHGRRAEVTRRYVLSEPNHMPEEWAELLRFYDQAHAAQARAAVLRPAAGGSKP